MFISHKTKKIIIFTVISLVLFFGLGLKITLAQDIGLNAAANIGLLAPSSTDIRLVIVNIIRFILGFLGLLATIMILYGGWLWMTSNGDLQRVQAAKRTLIAAIIGLIIIIAAFAIVTIIVGFIQGAINSTTTTDSCGNSCDYTTQHCCSGTCTALGTACSGTLPPGTNSFYIKGTNPYVGMFNVPRNVVVKIYFNHNLNSSVDAVLNNNFTVTRIEDNINTATTTVTEPAINGTISFSGRATINFVDPAACGDEKNTPNCFDAWSTYEVKVDAGTGCGMSGCVVDINGQSLDCTNGRCDFLFHTNSLVDTLPPTAGIVSTEICHDDGSLPDSANSVPGWGRDDVAVDYLQFYLDGVPISPQFPDTGHNYYEKEYKYDTTGLTVGSTHDFSVRAYDMVANMASSSFTTTVRVGHCCNGVKDADETDIDCGGADCDSCASMNPIITNITPDNGATGNFITISGRHFGAAQGNVYFSDDSGNLTVLASFPNPAICPNNWQDNQIIVMVPAGASTNPHPIKIVRADSKEDTTAADSPPEIDFTRNTTVRPGLCSVSPQQGYFNDTLTYSGNNFSLTNGTIRFGDYTDYITANNISFLTNASAQANVPNISRGITTTYVRDNNSSENSNPFYFTVLYNANSNPIIDYIDPGQGPNNQYITIYGSNFMSYNGSVSRVTFISNATLASTTAGIDFPAKCRDSWWHDKYIVVKVPSSGSASIGGYRVVVTNGAANTSNAVDFNIISGSAGPGICKLDPHNGPVSTVVNVYGDNFNNSRAAGYVNFYQNTPATIYSNWANQIINTSVPTGAVTGQVNIFQNSTSSNSLPFTVGSCTQNSECDTTGGEQCCTSGQWQGICRTSCTGTAYATTTFGWTFSTASSTTSLLGQPCYYGATPATCDTTKSTCDPATSFCDPSSCTCQATSTSADSCQGVAQATGHCLTTQSCPNSPGNCSPHTSTGNVATGQSCDDTCAGVTNCTAATCDYDSNLDTCVLAESVCGAEFPDAFGNNLAATCVAYQGTNHWRVSTTASCPTTNPLVNNWVRIPGNYCVDTLSTCNPCPSNFSCRDYNGDKRCVASQRLCSGNASCVGNQCVIPDNNTCQCCCRKAYANADCCAPLTCAGACGAETDPNNPNLGLCSGCASAGTTAADHDAACNCTGHYGKYCSITTANPEGVCLDCAILSASDCNSHDACCIDQKSGGNCRGVGANGSKNAADGSCAYFTCSTTGGAPTCSENDTAGTYKTSSDCNASCGAGGAGVLCQSNTPTSSCTSGVPKCSAYFTCLNNPYPIAPDTGACRCCCDPTGANTCPTGLQCLANKGSCTGTTRGLCCGCKANTDCQSATDGCGKDTCCHARPNAGNPYPANQATKVCRNTLISVTFDTKMDTNSFTGNLILLGNYGTNSCPAGTQYLAFASEQLKQLTWLEKIKKAWQGLLAVIWPNNNALAQWSPVVGNTYCALTGQTSGYTNASGQTVLDFSPSQALDASTTYFVVIEGDTNLDNSRGVLSIDGVGMAGPNNDTFNGIAYSNSYVWAFQTSGDVCSLDNVVIVPDSYLFTVPNSNQDFMAEPHAANGQIISSLTGVYEWAWSWKTANPAVVTLTPVSSLTTKQQVTSQNVKDAKTTVSATANITVDSIDSMLGQSITGSADVYVFLCENPWPPRNADGTWAPWRDTSANCTIANLGCNNFNYELYYCRDAGKLGTYDDLPAIISNPAVTTGSSSASLKETYFFRETVPTATTSNFTITNDGTGNSLTVSWNGVANVDTYRLYWGTSHGNYSNHQDTTVNSYQVTGLTRNVVYYFLLDGISGNQVERALYNEATSSPTKTIAPAAPGGLQAATTTTGVQLSWNAVTDASSYKVYYGTTAGVYGQSQNVGNVTKVVVTGLAGNNSYYFSVTAIDVAGNESAYATAAHLTLP